MLDNDCNMTGRSWAPRLVASRRAYALEPRARPSRTSALAVDGTENKQHSNMPAHAMTPLRMGMLKRSKKEKSRGC
jgi:hypothetical protein